MEAALFLIERRLKAEVGFLHVIADADQILDCVLGLIQAAVNQSRVRSPVSVVHNVMEDFVDFKRRAAFAGMQDGSVNRKGSGNLDAVDACDRAGLFNGENLGAQLACTDGGHKAGTAAADHADVDIVGLIRAGNLLDRSAEPGVRITAGLRHAVRDGFLHSAGGVGSSGDAVQAEGLILNDRGNQLVLHLGEEDRGLILRNDVDFLKGCLTEGAFYSHIAQVTVGSSLVSAGLVGAFCFGGRNSCHTQGGEAEGTGSSPFQKVTTSDLFAHLFSFFLLIFVWRCSTNTATLTGSLYSLKDMLVKNITSGSA